MMFTNPHAFEAELVKIAEKDEKEKLMREALGQGKWGALVRLPWLLQHPIIKLLSFP